MLDTKRLYSMLNACRTKEGLTWRDLALELKVAPSTFTRLKTGRPPSANGLCAMLAWLNAGIEDVTNPPITVAVKKKRRK